MKFFRSIYLSLSAALLIAGNSLAETSVQPLGSRGDGKALVQLAILLDTSNSMDGLIEQAKSQLWKVVNDLEYSTQDGQRPTLQVALYEYGNDGLKAEDNYIRQVMPFTTDLDVISEKLFALRTNGGSEYCGAVIRNAVKDLAWDSRGDVYKVIFIAGNEPFTQGPVPYRESIEAAVRKGIVVNPIFCGPNADGIQTQWYDGAMAGHGSYLNIDHNATIVAVPTPYDQEIARLGSQMNDTYVAYGTVGRAAQQRQNVVDKYSLSMAETGALTERALNKAAPQAAAPAWDAVSVVASGKVRAASLNRKDLPAELQGKSNEEIEKVFKVQQSKRDKFQARLIELRTSRETFLAQKQLADNKAGPMSLDQAMRKAIRTQAAAKNFKFSR